MVKLQNYIKTHKFSIALIILAGLFYYSFGYDLIREDLFKLLGLCAALFFVSFKLLKIEQNNFNFLAAAGILFRLIFLFSLPTLSQDYFRFIWDGSLIIEGINPYLYTPNTLIGSETSIFHGSDLINSMGALSAGNYTNYPPIHQFIFAISALLSSKSILGAAMLMRGFIIIADIGILIIGKKLLQRLKLPTHRIFWYFLNPFIIIELTGNLHFEGIMCFFLVAALYFLHRNKWILSAMLLGLSISVKLLPLLLLPLFLGYFEKGLKLKKKSPSYENEEESLGFLKLLGYYLIVLFIIALSFAPFYDKQVFNNFSSSVGLWFGKFEFNASIYYLIRWIGFQIKGYNIIETVGKILPAITFLIIMGLSFFRRNFKTQQLITNMVFVLCVYLMLSTTVHPWYLTMPLLLSVFTKYRFMIVWCAVIFVSYSAYISPESKEKLWLIFIEYAVVLGVFYYEFTNKKIAALN